MGCGPSHHLPLDGHHHHHHHAALQAHAAYRPRPLPPQPAAETARSTSSSHSPSPPRRRQQLEQDPAQAAGEQHGGGGEACEPGEACTQLGAGQQRVTQLGGEHEEQPEPIVPFSWTKGELVGIGAFGRVFSALNNVTGELVAVKQVSFARDEALQGRVAEHIRALEAEVRVLRNLKHDNIVRYLGTERTEDSLHIFLEFVPGGSIASLLAKFGPFPESVIRVYTAQLLRGLEYLHQKGIMHRDIKGANILIDKAGTVKLADFGASKKIEDLATVGSGSKSIRGTPYWMAPEVIKQTGHGRPADIWSLACTVIEMATGKPPWSAYTAPVAAMFQIASSKDPPPLPEHLSREGRDFLLLCFNRVARDRANATRLLKHPFVANVQLQGQALPFPSTPPSTVSSSSSPGGHCGSGGAPRAGPAGSRAALPLAHEATRGHARASTGVAPSSLAHGSSRPPLASSMSAAQAAAIKAAQAARASPPSRSPKHPSSQQQHQHQQASTAALCQRGDAAAVVSASSRGQPQPQLQHAAAGSKQQQDGKQQSPRLPFDTYRPQQHQQQQQHAGSRSATPPQAPGAAAAASGGAAAATASSGSGAAEAGPTAAGCMTLVDWNPMCEPSWAPGSYQLPGQRADGPGQQQHAGARGGRGQEQQEQEPPDTDAPRQPGGPGSLQGSGRGLVASSSSTSSAQSAGLQPGPSKRAGGLAGPAAGSILGAGPGPAAGSGSKRGGIGSRRLGEAGSSSAGAPASSGASSTSSSSAGGPLSQGPAGRARDSAALSASLAAAGRDAAAGQQATGKQLQQASKLSRAGGSSGMLQQQASAGSGLSSPAGGACSPGRGSSAADQRTSRAHPAGSSAQQVGGGAKAAAAPGQPAADTAGGGGEDAKLSSKRAQWESELMEELERHRQEQRANRQQAAA